jgi:hypothetical protein
LFSGKKRAPEPAPDAPGPHATSQPDQPLHPVTGRPQGPSARRRGTVAGAASRWRSELAALGGPNALVDMAALGNTVLDLSSAHPSGMAQLYAGRPTPLQNLIREHQAFLQARERAHEVQVLADQHATRYGLPPTHLSMGIAFWTEYVDEPSTGRAHPATTAEPAATATGEGPASDTPGDADGETPAEPANVVPLRTPDAAPAEKRAVQRRLPILLRPINLLNHPRTGEPALQLEPGVEMNPVLVRALRARGCVLDPEHLIDQARAGVSFSPSLVLQRVEAMGRTVFKDFRVRDKLIVGVFQHPGQLLVEDLDSGSDALAGRPIVAALAGDGAAQHGFKAQELPGVVMADRPPDHERGIGDLDIEQQHVLDVVAAGDSVFIDAGPGAPIASTIAAVIADTVGSGRSVLYVTGNRRASHAVIAGLADAGLSEAVLDLQPKPGWQRAAVRRLREGLDVKAPALDIAGIGQVRQALAERSEQIAAYVRSLHGSRDPWNISAYDALQAIAQVTSDRPGTRTAVRLDENTCLALQTEGLDRARHQIVRLAELGSFRLGPLDTAWFGATIDGPEQAAGVLDRLDRLRSGALAQTREAMRTVAAETGLAQSDTLAAWGEQLDMLAGIRECLDVFLPLVFERPPDDMVAATATEEWREAHGIKMKAFDKRRLRKQAKDMVRPGRVVDDLNAELVKLAEQREIWLKWNPSAAWPKLPAGMAQIDEEYRAVRQDADALSEALAGAPAVQTDLAHMTFDDLELTLQRLDATRAVLEFWPEAGTLERGLRADGLGDLLDDLRARRVGLEPGAGLQDLTAHDQDVAELAGFELDLAWWSSVLSFILEADPLLGAYNRDALAALAESYRELDRAHVATKPGPIAAAIVRWRDQTRETHPGQAEALQGADDSTPLRQLVADAPEIAMRSRPCWVAGPMLVPQALPLGESSGPVADLVILDSVRHVSAAQAVPSLARGAQVVVVGDSARLGEAPHGVGTALAEFLPHVQLVAPPSRRDPRLTTFLADRGYETLAAPLPLPSRENLIEFGFVDATGKLLPGAASVESTDEEVQEVVRRVVAQVRLRGRESLSVVTVSLKHAERLREALAHVAGQVPELAQAMDPGNAEPLVVADLARAAGVARDTVIFSPGYARTERGSVLYDFGPLSKNGGEGLLLDMLMAVRQRLVVVSALHASDLAPERVKSPGTRLLRDLLGFVEDPGPAAEPHGEEVDALFADLAERLTRRGFTVSASYGLADGRRIPLVISHKALEERQLVAVLTDDPSFVREPSVRAQVRGRPAQLEALGWRTVQVWSPAVFMDPESEAKAIAAAATEELERLRPGVTAQVSPAGQPVFRGMRRPVA